jgi:predicted transcriptional regulator
MDYHDRQAEHLVKRFTKAELIPTFARILRDYTQRIDDLRVECSKHAEKCGVLNDKLKEFEAIEGVLKMIGMRRSSVEQVFEDILDNCEKIIEACETGEYAPTVALDLALEDRAALLRRLGLTDAQWSAQGGASYADFEF